MTAAPARAVVDPQLARIEGSWRITRILPTTNSNCWTKDRAASLVGSTLTYHRASMSWQGGNIALDGITARTVSAAGFRSETSGAQPATFAQLGIQARSVIEIDMQHEDQDITGSSTEVPGDSVLLAAPNRIVVSACGVYMEAVRIADKPQPKSKAKPRRK